MKGMVAMLGLVALLAGCGSYTKRDFTAGADAICASTVRAIRAIPPPAASTDAAQELRDLGAYLGRVVPILESETKQIHALQRPTESAAAADARKRYLAALAQSVTAYKQLAASAQAGDASGAAGAEAALRSSPVSSLAAAYGLNACATPGATVA